MTKVQKIWIGVVGVWVIASVGSIFAQSNPAVSNTVQWDSPRTEELFTRACADCHSHQTKWPWYAGVAPMSFVIIHHVNEGREHFNVSIADMGESDEAGEEVEEGEMPLAGYLRFHPEANLTEQEKEELIQGLEKTFPKTGHEGTKHKHDDKD